MYIYVCVLKFNDDVSKLMATARWILHGLWKLQMYFLQKVRTRIPCQIRPSHECRVT